MSKIQKVLAVGGWVVAFATALYLYITTYVAQTPFPAGSEIETVQPID